MAIQLMQLPAVQAPRNALIDFSPINQGIAQYRQGMDQAYTADMGRKVSNALAAGDYKGAMAATDDPGVALQVGQAQRQQAQEGRSQKQFDADWFGNQAMAIANLPMGAERVSAWNAFIAKHPDKASLDPAHMDPRSGPQIVSAEYGKYKDELEKQKTLASIELAHAQAAKARAEASNGGMTPSNVKEWAYYSALPPDKQEQYIRMKRADKALDLGTSFAIPNPANPAGPPTTTVAKDVAGEARAKTIGKEMGEGVMALPKAATALKMYHAQDKVVSDTIDKAIGQSSAWTTGFLGSATSRVPGTPGYDLRNTLNTIKANIGFDKLQAMRDASPTGGALGQVSEMENVLLQSTIAAAEQSQSKDQLVENLNKIKAIRQQFARVKQEAYDQDVARFGAAAMPAMQQQGRIKAPSQSDLPIMNSPEEARRLPSGTQFMTPDGRTLRAP